MQRNNRTRRRIRRLAAYRSSGGNVGRTWLLTGILMFPLVLTLAFLVTGAAVAKAAYDTITADLPPVSDFSKDPLPLATRVYARDGVTLLYEFAEERREPVRYAEVPEALIQATIAAEDRTFWTNPGIDVMGITRAALANLQGRNGERPQGASTITQQLVKQRLVGDEVSITRKIKEAVLALEVAKAYSKEQILELYLNQIYYGAQAYGIKAAARAYFGTSDLYALSLGQIALLAGIPQSPAYLEPINPANLERVTARRAYVLNQMAENGFITREQAHRAEAEPVALSAPPIASIVAPHYVFQVRNELTRMLGTEAAVYRGGYKVVTSLDPKLQQLAEETVARWVEELHVHNVWNAALVSMDPRTGEVLAYVGSVDYYNTADARVQGQYDAAGIGLRQPGSSFKVFAYITALKRGATAATVVVDARTDFGGGYRPENADLQYHGPVTMRQAIRESRNVPAIKFLLRYAGLEETIKTARSMGLTADFEGAQAGPSLALGSVPVKLTEMTAGYATMANLGVYTQPTYVLSIEDPRGQLVYKSEPLQKRALEPEVAWIMNDILSDTTNPATSYVFGNWTHIGRPAALKTGTTDNLKDVYSVGYTPQLVTGVWMGNSNGEEMSSRGFFSAMGPGQLWRDFMREAHADKPLETWPRPASVVRGEVAVAPGAYGGYGPGLLPEDGPRSGVMHSSEWFVRGTAPVQGAGWFRDACPDMSTSAPESPGGPELNPGGPSAAPSASPPAAPSASPAAPRRQVMVINEDGFAAWAPSTARWVSEAMAGIHDYGRYPWSAILSDGGPCPTPAPTPVPTPTPVRTPMPTASAGPSQAPSASPAPGATPPGTGSPRPSGAPSALPTSVPAPTPTQRPSALPSTSPVPTPSTPPTGAAPLPTPAVPAP